MKKYLCLFSLSLSVYVVLIKIIFKTRRKEKRNVQKENPKRRVKTK